MGSALVTNFCLWTDLFKIEERIKGKKADLIKLLIFKEN